VYRTKGLGVAQERTEIRPRKEKMKTKKVARAEAEALAEVLATEQAPYPHEEPDTEEPNSNCR
jgi:hypothetical protein